MPFVEDFSEDWNDDNFSSESGSVSTWKDSLDSLLSPSSSPQQRMTLLKDLLSSSEDIREDVRKAISDRDVDSLMTDGTKDLIDGTNAVAFQLRNDIIPTLSKPIPPPSADTLSTAVPKAASQIFNAVQAQVDNLKGGGDVVGKVREGMELIEKSMRSTGPPYEVLKSTEHYEVRSYPPYVVAATSMREAGGKWDENDLFNSGVAFNLLTGFVMGGNEQKKTIGVKLPVETTSLGEMRLYLGDEGDEYPDPLSFENKINEFGAVSVTTLPPKIVCCKRFKGFATQQETERQLDKLVAYMKEVSYVLLLYFFLLTATFFGKLHAAVQL